MRRTPQSLAGRVLIAALAGIGCVEPSTTLCVDGRTCPGGTVCADALHLCVLPEQLSSCASSPDHEGCSFAGIQGVCNQGTCLEVGCGDGFVDPQTEECDYLSDAVYDCQADARFYEAGVVGCTATCRFDTRSCSRSCGDEVLDPEEFCEGTTPAGYTCIDFGFHSGRLGCSSLCQPDVTSCRTFNWRRTPVAVAGAITAISIAGDTAFAVDVVGSILRKVLPDGTWEVVAREPSGLRGIWAASPTLAWAVGGGGTMLKYDGTTWSPVQLPAAASTSVLVSVHGSAPNNVFAISDRGLILRFDGTQWTVSHPTDGEGMTKIWVASATEAYVGRYTNGTRNLLVYNGSTWTDGLVGTTSTNVNGVWTAGNQRWAATSTNGVYHDSGSGWTQAVLPDFGFGSSVDAVWGTAAGEAFAVGSSTWYFDGSSWSTITPPIAHSLLAVTSADGRVLAGGDFGTILQNDGTFRVRDRVEANADIQRIDVVGTDRYASGEDTLFRYDETQGQWAAVSSPLGEYVQAIAIGDPGDVFVFGIAGGVYRGSSTSGFTQQATYPHNFGGAWADGSNEVWAVGTEGFVLHYDGQTWSQEQLPNAQVALQDVHGTPGAVFAVGNDGQIWRRPRQSGATWQSMTSPTQGELFAVWGTSDDNVYAAGATSLAHYDGTAWSDVDVPLLVHFYAIWGTGPDDIFVAGAGGIVYHFDGNTWNLTDVGVTQYVWGGSASSREVVLAASAGPPTRIVRRISWQ